VPLMGFITCGTRMILTGRVLGAALGYVLQRSRFRVTGAVRALHMARLARHSVPLPPAIALQAIRVAALTRARVTAAHRRAFAPLAVIGGGLLFGGGTIMAGGCATGTYYRAGEGLIGSWVALVFYALFAAVMKYGPLGGFTEAARARTVGDATLQETLGVSV